jgi:hypothetical protein
MAHAQPRRSIAPSGAASASGLPSAGQLARLSHVLCAYPVRQGGVLEGWGRAVRVEACAGLDGDDMHECLRFLDHEGRCCWRLYLLPDTNFLAWDRLLARLPACSASVWAEDARHGLLRRFIDRRRNRHWCACIVRLHRIRDDAVSISRSRAVLAASAACVSPLGLDAARSIARGEGLHCGNGRPVHNPAHDSRSMPRPRAPSHLRFALTHDRP